MSKILIAGGTGLVGSNLVEKLKQKKYEIVLLTTQKQKADNEHIFYWQPYKNDIPNQALKDISICINLCGAGIFDKAFTAQRKKELYDSRIISAEVLLNGFKQNGQKIKHYIGASATGFYPNISEKNLTENDKKGNWFISNLVADWEKAHQQFKDIAENIFIVRTGIVLSNKGGFLQSLIQPIKLLAGTILGNGKQIISWVHVDDLTNMMIWSIEQKLTGTYNAVSGNPENLATITKTAANILNKPLWLPNIPTFMLKILFGERYLLLICSQNVSNKKITETGFNFHYNDLKTALQNLLKK